MRKLFHKQGSLIHKEAPFACVLQSRYRAERCDKCFKQGKVLKCSNCLYVRYCNRFCQKEAWPEHQEECGKLKEIGESRVVPDAALMMSRIIRKLLKGGDLTKGYYTAKSYRRFWDLMAHEEDICKDAKRMEHFQALTVVLRSLIDEPAMPSNQELLRIFGKICINTFNILDNEMNSIGTGMYLGASIMDHSCRPNAVATFDGCTINVRLLEDYQGGEIDFGKIFISYIDLLNPADLRREQLRNRYYFECGCERCRDEQEQKVMNAGACSNTQCDEAIVMTAKQDRCPGCSTAIKQNEREKFREITAFTMTQLEQMKDVAYLDICELCLFKQQNVLHHYNVWHLKTLDQAFETAINMEKWEDAEKYGNQLKDGFRRYNGPFHPLFGLLLLKLGKIQIYLKHGKEALTNINNSEKILRVTHGEEHDLYKSELIPLLCQAAAEYEAANNGQ